MNPPEGVGPNDVQTAAGVAPEHAERGLLVIHGAGSHARHTTLNELLNPTLARMREERCLVRVSPITAGSESAPGGAYDGLVVEYTTRPIPGDLPRPYTINRLLVLEGRWDQNFVDTRMPEVSAFIGARASRMLWEVFLYHFRSLYAFIVALATLVLIVGGVALSILDLFENDNRVGFAMVALGLSIAFVAALLDATAPWRDSEERYYFRDQRVPSVLWLWNVFPAFTMSIFHIQRAIVLVVTASGIVILPLAAFLARVFGTVPGLRALTRGLINALESALLTGAPTDVEAIANNYVAAGAIQNRVQGALLELESRLDEHASITVLAHSAGAPIAWWLLSEPGIHERQDTKPLRYSLITVGGALNWMQRGLDCQATPLSWPLVNSTAESSAGRTTWINAFSTWDPTPHGAVRRAEYKGDWKSILDRPHEPEPEPGRPTPAVVRPFMVLRDRWASACALRAGEAEKKDKRQDPNVLCRNLGSPISAEHSEYFRNQQEFVPLLLTAIDERIPWADREIQNLRRCAWANLRLAMMSGLVRARIVTFAAPAAYVLLLPVDQRIFTMCEENRHRFENSWLAALGDKIYYWITLIPVVGDGIAETICNHIWIEDIIVVLALALVAYAVVEVYTSFCWASLGRRVQTLAPPPPEDAAQSPDDAAEPGSERVIVLGADKKRGRPRVLLGGMMLLWLPTMLLPLAYLPFQLGAAWYVFFGANTVLSVAEAYWFRRCQLGAYDPTRYADTIVGQGRYAQPAFI